MKAIMMLTIVLTLFAGCCPQEMAEPAAPAKTNLTPTRTTAKDVIEGFTGKTAVDAGRRTRAKVEQLGAEKKKEREEINKLISP